MRPTSTTSSTALILSHPGHELRVLGWLETVRPLVLILTDGSGHTTQPRIELSCQLIEGAGGRLGALCGKFTDQQFYQAILEQDLSFFIQLQTLICDTLREQQIDLVVGDSIEGYNPSHDLCRSLIDSAVHDLQQISGRTVQNYEFPLVDSPSAWSDREGAWCHTLNPTEQKWKLAQIRDYAQKVGGTLLEEVEEMLAQFGEDILGEEWFSPSTSGQELSHFEETPPFYERHGARQVSAGYYQRAIEFRQHMLPLISALGRHDCT